MKTSPPSADQRPLDFALVRRIYAYTRPHARLRNRLIFMVLLRSLQLPAVTWGTAAVIPGIATLSQFWWP